MNAGSSILSRRAFLAALAAAALLPPRSGLGEPAADVTEPSRTPMLTRAIPSSSEPVPVIGMGTWQTFDPDTLDEASLAPLEAVVKTFHEAGGRLVDSSPMYGKAEAVTGQLATKLGINPALFVATKVWTSGREAGEKQMTASLRKLGRERLELMQVHNLVDWQTHLRTLRAWKEQGRFRYIGVTHYQVSAFDQLEQIVRNEKLDFVQLPYSLAVRDAERRLLPAAQEAGVAVLVNRPFEEGALFRAVKDKPLPEEFKAFAESWAQAFLKFIVSHPAVTCVIPATSKPHHMQDNLQAGFGEMPDETARRRLASVV